VHRVRVPKDFGKQVITWTLTVNGKTNKAYGELLPTEEITERIVMTRGNLNPGEGDPNKPPAVTIAPIQGLGIATPVTLTAVVQDDGLPKPRVPVERPKSVSDATKIQAQANTSSVARPRGLTVSWMQLRGPAKVTLDSAAAKPVAEGKSSTTARFPQPGTYVLRAIANDGALSTKTDVTIEVTGSPATP
jgi:hypothetical protein